MAVSKQLALRVPNNQLAAIDDFFQRQGLVEWALKSKNGEQSLTGRTRNGDAIRLAIYNDNGFREKTTSVCKRLPREKRILEVKRLSRRGLTQDEIAQRLGCSQKTVSNDLNS